MAVAELQAPSKSGCTLPDRFGACAKRLSAAEKARIPNKLRAFRRRLDGKVSTPYYAVSEVLFEWREFEAFDTLRFVTKCLSERRSSDFHRTFCCGRSG